MGTICVKLIYNSSVTFSMKAAVDEGQKSANVDLTHMLYSCKKCTECILKLQKSDSDDIRLVRNCKFYCIF